MEKSKPWLLRPEVWLELFVTVNLAFLALDIYLAHSVNEFHHWGEYVPLYFSMIAPGLLIIGLVLRDVVRIRSVWRDVGFLVGWISIGIGLVGTVLHLESRFFVERTLKSLIYAAPFAAPLAYTGLGLLLLLNRMVRSESESWARWILLFTLGGFLGNFIFSLTDHAQNGFFHSSEWIAVGVSALGVGMLTSLFCTPVSRRYLWLCGGMMGLQVVVGLLGFYYHVAANFRGISSDPFENFVHGTPAMAPLLFPNLAVLGIIGLIVLGRFVPGFKLGRESKNNITLLTTSTETATRE